MRTTILLSLSLFLALAAHADGKGGLEEAEKALVRARFEAKMLELRAQHMELEAAKIRLEGKRKLLEAQLRMNAARTRAIRAGKGAAPTGAKAMRGRILHRIMRVLLGQQKRRLAEIKDPKKRARAAEEVAQMRKELAQRLSRHGAQLFPESALERIERALAADPKRASLRLRRGIQGQIARMEKLGLELPGLTVTFIQLVQRQGAEASVLDLMITYRLNEWALERAGKQRKKK